MASSNIGPDIPGMTGGVRINVPFLPTTLAELDRLQASKVFVLANNSSRPFVAPLISALEQKGTLAAPLSSDVSMGGGETGLLKACDTAADAGADCVVTFGGGAVQDAGKLIRLWLAGRGDSSEASAATADGIKAVTSLSPIPPLPPQVCIPNSFAMAELTSVAGMTLKSNVKSGAANPCLMPTAVIFDPVLTEGLPDWVRFGTALRCVEHAVGAITHPKANDYVRETALKGLEMSLSGLEGMVKDPTSHGAVVDMYSGGWNAIRALNTNGCYPSVSHLIQNIYAAKYDVHQGACSGILCARILDYHKEGSGEYQRRIAAVLGDGTKSAARLVVDLVAMLPGVAKDHADAGVDVAMLREFANGLPLARLNGLSPTPFKDSDDVYGMLIKPLDQI